MTELSPAAQAVLDAAFDPWQSTDTPVSIAAAVLRAAADQVVPEPDDWDKDNFSIQALRLRCVMRDQILAIAAELEGNND
jgi:hypothetical protein